MIAFDAAMTEPRRKNDARIQADVCAELARDTRVEPADIGVQVHDAVVTLNGTVDSATTRLAAQEAAHRVAGVLDVANDLEVVPPGAAERSDTEIARRVRQEMQFDLLVPDGLIRTTVSNGVVTLVGTVDTAAQVHETVRVVRSIGGVREVTSLLVVEKAVATLDKLQKAIDEALETHSRRSARHVQIAVEGDTVKLSGEVA